MPDNTLSPPSGFVLDSGNPAPTPSEPSGGSPPAGFVSDTKPSEPAVKPPAGFQLDQQSLGAPAQEPEDPNAPWYSKLWGFANSPLIDSQSIKKWTGYEPTSGVGKGLEDLATGFTSPLMIALTLGTLPFGGEGGALGGLLDTGGGAALRAAGSTSAEIADIAKGSKAFSQAIRAGKSAEEGLGAVEAAGINKDLFVKGLNTLKDSGLGTEALTSRGTIRQVTGASLRAAGRMIDQLHLDAATTDKVGRFLQFAVDAGFTAQNAAAAVSASPRVLDAIKAGDYDSAERLAVNAVGSGIFAGLGAHGAFHEGGALLDDAAAASGLKVKPSEENTKLAKEFGLHDRNVVTAGRAEDLWADDLRKKYPDLAKDPAELHRVMKWVQSGEDEPEMARRYNALAEAAGVDNRIPRPVSGQDAQQALDAETPVKADEQPAYQYTPTDTSAPVEGTFYHGTKADMNSVAEADPAYYGKVGALYGTGLYLTDNPRVAESYARTKGKGVEGKVFPTQVNEARLIDLEKPLAPEVAQAFSKAGVDLTPEQLQGTGKQVFENLKQEMEDQGHTEGDAVEAYQNLAVNLKQLGYDGFRHEGGQTPQGKQFGSHNAIILFPDYGAGRPLSDVITPGGDPHAVKQANFDQAMKELAPGKRVGELSPIDLQRVGLRAHELDTGKPTVSASDGSPTDLGGVEPNKAERAMDAARERQLIDQQLVKAKYTPKEVQALLDSYDPRKLTDAHKALAREVADHLNENLESAQKSGLLSTGVENYITQIWQKEAENNPAVNRILHQTRTGQFAVNTSMARRRMFMNAFEGELTGRKLAETDLIALTAHNGNTFARVAEARALVARLADKGLRASDGRPMMAPAGTGSFEQGADGENPAVFVNPEGIRDIRIADKVISGLKQNGDLDRLLEEGTVVSLGKDNNGNDRYAWNAHDYLPVDHSSMKDWRFATQDENGNPVLVKAEMRAHPEAFDYLQKRLGLEKSQIQSTKLGRGLLAAGREAKGLLLSFSPFHIMQEGLRAVMTGVSPFGIPRWDPNTDPILGAGIEHGLTLGKDYRGVQDFQEGLTGHSKILDKIPFIGKSQAWLQHFLFDKYIPGLKSRAFNELYERYQKAYPDWTDDKVAETAAADTNERFGGINYRKMGRSIVTQDLFRLTALAPDWLESEVRFIARTFGDEGKVARKDIARMAVGMWATARVMNYVFTGNGHYEAPFGVAIKTDDGREKIYGIRSLPGDLLHLVSDPSNFLTGRVAPLVRTGVQAYTGRDEFGRKLPTHNIVVNLLQSAARSVAPLPFQTIAKAATGDTPEVSNVDAGLKAAGLAVQPYRTEAMKVAATLASDHNEQGPLDPSKVRKHSAMIQIEDSLRSGQTKMSDIFRAVDTGQLAPAEAKAITKNVQDTRGLPSDMARLYTRAARLAAPELLKIWDVANSDERAALAPLLLKAKNRYLKRALTDMTPQERLTDENYIRLRRMFSNQPNF